MHGVGLYVDGLPALRGHDLNPIGQVCALRMHLLPHVGYLDRYGAFLDTPHTSLQGLG